MVSLQWNSGKKKSKFKPATLIGWTYPVFAVIWRRIGL